MGFAKPARAEEVADKGGVVMLAIDTSLSMEATDVSPTADRSGQGSRHVVPRNVPDGVRIGVVGFDGSSQILLDPTDDTAAVHGPSIVCSSARAPRSAKPSSPPSRRSTRPILRTTATARLRARRRRRRPAPTQLTGAIVLLSDGETTEGRPNDEAAQAATAAGVAVNTIAFGTDSGIVTGPDGTQIPVPVNRDALKTLADGTGGTYFSAFTADQLKQVYEKLGESVESPRPCTTRSPTGSRSRRWRSQSWPASARSSGSAACPDPPVRVCSLTRADTVE